MKKDILMITVSEVLFQMAEGSMNMYGIIFFYTSFGNSIIAAALPFVLRHFLHAFLLPLFSRLILKLGIKKSIYIASFFYIIACFTVFLTNTNLTVLAIVVWAVASALGNIFHYVPFIYVIGLETDHDGRGRVFSIRRIILIVFAIAIPVMGGFISQYFGLAGLMILCMAFYFLANIPILSVSISEFKPGKKLLDLFLSLRGKHITLFKAAQVFSDDVNNFWPIFVFLIVASSYSNLGIIFAFVSFGSIVISYLIGFELDHHNRLKLYEMSAITNLFSWFARALSFNYITVLVTDILYRLNGDFRGSIIDVIDFDLQNDQLQDNRISAIFLSETVINYFIAAGFLLSAIVITLTGFQASFIIMALFGFTLTLLSRKSLRRG